MVLNASARVNTFQLLVQSRLVLISKSQSLLTQESLANQFDLAATAMTCGIHVRDYVS